MHAPCSRCGVLGWACPPRARYPAAVAGLTLPAIVHFRATLSATHPAAMAMAASSSFWCGGEAAGAARRSGVPSSPTHKSAPHDALFFRSRNAAPPRASERLRIGQEHGARPDVGVVDVRHGAYSTRQYSAEVTPRPPAEVRGRPAWHRASARGGTTSSALAEAAST